MIFENGSLLRVGETRQNPYIFAMNELAQYLEDNATRVAALRAVTGFDGFVDEMVTLVNQRQDVEQFERVATIADFGRRISDSAGQSSLQEVVVTRQDAGGCAVNLGDALADLSVQVETFATVGEPVHAAFAAYQQKAHVTSWGSEPGRTIAFEFADGKCMFSAVSQLAKFTPEDLTRRLEDGCFEAACQGADLIAFTDWTLYPHMTACWQFLKSAILEKLGTRKPLFVDLVDPSSRNVTDIRAMLTTLTELNTVCAVHLGLNQNEANQLDRILGHAPPQELTRDFAGEQAQRLREALQLDAVVIHSRTYAAAAEKGATVALDWEPFPQPVKSTGAGDRFNSGYTLGVMLNVSLESRLWLACITTSLYVARGRSATLPEVIAALRRLQGQHSAIIAAG